MGSTFSSCSWKSSRLIYEGDIVSYDEHTPKKMTTSLSLPSSSSNVPQIKYDVFISFRGSDTRRGFLSHLINALSHAKIEAFVDYKLREGDELSQALSTAIEESQIALVVFSKNYASSKWCLEELVKITECMMKYGQIVVPIFYNVDPSHVRHQNGCYKKAFAKYEELFKDNIIKVKKWRTALEKVANLSGFHSSKFWNDGELIKDVIRRVLRRLMNHRHQIDSKGLVGIDKPIADLQSLVFCNGSNDVRLIGIWGMAGIGKTTIAGVLFNRLCSEYEGCHFLVIARKQLEKYELIQLRNELILNLLEDKELNIGTYGVPYHVLRRLRRKKILVVLDDVNDPDEVIGLVGGHDWLGPGSRIIVTTRDRHVICKADVIYELKLLGYHEAQQLLHLHAFNGRCVQQNWQSLMLEVVQYADGNPLALKVLGSFLYGKSAEEWKSQLQKLEKMPNAKIQNVLRLSYEGLDRDEKCVFLYIACFFEDDDAKDRVIMLLEACGYSTPIALKNLQDRCLIIIISRDFWEDTVSMHKLIREMGQEIVREQSIGKPGERSHLWDPDEICQLLKHDEGTEHIESLTLDLSRVGYLSLSPHCFARMVNLKFLRFYNDTLDKQIKLHISEGFEIRSSNISLFHWDGYPSKSLPTTFNAKNLVELRMQDSRVTKLWDGVQDLPKLKVIDLQRSRDLVELPDLSKAPRLQYLYLASCDSLVFVHSSIWSLSNVEKVDLLWCPRLEELSAIEALPSSVTFHSNLRLLRLADCVCLKHLPDSFSKFTSLESLLLVGCEELDTSNLQIIFDGLHSLKHLSMDRCYKLYELPENICKLASLYRLSLSETSVKSLPESIKHLSQLQYLYLNSCMRLQSIPELPPSLMELTANDCTSLERLFTPTPQVLEQHFTLAFKLFSFRNCPNLDKDALDAYEVHVQCWNKRRDEMLGIQRWNKRRKEMLGYDYESDDDEVDDDESDDE